MLFYQYEDIVLGEATQAGHEIYLNAQYPGYLERSGQAKHIVFKRNKYQKAQYSRYEVAFTKLACLLFSPGLTTAQTLVVDEKAKVVGLASDYIFYTIAAKEQITKGSTFYTVPKDIFSGQWTAKHIDSPADIPSYFLNKQPADFFARLVAAEQQGSLSIDYASLAAILAGSYTLEEDDLHKGNLGFYLIEKNGKPHVSFFKIDHDLMFISSIMSFYGPRMQHLFNDQHAFDIKVDDLLDFPNLHHSANAYWPTKKSTIPHPWNQKEYHNQEEVNAFAGLANVDAFKKAKWLAFYKHILVPNVLIKSAVQECFIPGDPKDRAHCAVIIQSTIARQAQLRAALFSIAEFRSMVASLTNEEVALLKKDVLANCSTAVLRQECSEQIDGCMKHHQELCANKTCLGDTPLHMAIRLGEFRYEETLSMFGHCINQSNDAGQTPLDLALLKAKETNLAPVQEIGQDLMLTMKYLLGFGAKSSDAFKAFNAQAKVESYQVPSSYLDKAKKIKEYPQFKELLRDLGEETCIPLKLKKQLAVACVRQWIKSNTKQAEFPNLLRQLKKDIRIEAPELKYIRQLRSTLWVVRRIRGLYGWTSTQDELNTLINQAITKIDCAQKDNIPSKKTSATLDCFFVESHDNALQKTSSLSLDTEEPLDASVSKKIK